MGLCGNVLVVPSESPKHMQGGMMFGFDVARAPGTAR